MSFHINCGCAICARLFVVEVPDGLRDELMEKYGMTSQTTGRVRCPYCNKDSNLLGVMRERLAGGPPPDLHVGKWWPWDDQEPDEPLDLTDAPPFKCGHFIDADTGRILHLPLKRKKETSLDPDPVLPTEPYDGGWGHALKARENGEHRDMGKADYVSSFIISHISTAEQQIELALNSMLKAYSVMCHDLPRSEEAGSSIQRFMRLSNLLKSIKKEMDWITSEDGIDFNRIARGK